MHASQLERTVGLTNSDRQKCSSKIGQDRQTDRQTDRPDPGPTQAMRRDSREAMRGRNSTNREPSFDSEFLGRVERVSCNALVVRGGVWVQYG